jgi:hypothetical protein
MLLLYLNISCFRKIVWDHSCFQVLLNYSIITPPIRKKKKDYFSSIAGLKIFDCFSKKTENLLNAF